jgi:retron-type reverse transcriptase
MNERGKSDNLVVPAKPPNNAGGPAAEVVEGRRLAEGNTARPTRPGRSAGHGVPSGLDRVREVARRDKEARFTALLHHVDLDRLWAAYAGINPKAAPGIDQVTWDAYGQDLRANLEDLLRRVHSGAYRASPSRRVYIPKPDGRQRPLGIAVLEDKILQRAVVEVLNAVYEEDFLGFSYGFRPERGPHDALDALAVGISERKVNWILDADVSDFFTRLDHSWLERFLGHRIADKRVLRLIRKWLAAGVIEDGNWSETVEGSPQGASASPLLANVYLHYVLDLWADWWRRRYAHGEVIIVRFADLCRGRHKSAYADLWIMPALSEFSLVKSGHFAYGVGIILRPRQRPGFLVRISDSSGQEDDHGDEHSSRRRSADRGQHGAAGGVPQMAGPGTGPVGGVGPLLLQPGGRVRRRHWRGGSGRKPGRGQGHGVHGGLVPGP